MALEPGMANLLARAVQQEVPLDSAPFARLAEYLGLDEATVLAQLRAWRASGELREISGVLEGDRLGYESALVAAAVPESRLEAVATIISAHPTVTHNYLRDHTLNLWFTIAMPSRVGLAPALAILARQADIPHLHALPRTATYKIGVSFDLETLRNDTDRPIVARDAVPLSIGPREEALFRALQRPLPLDEYPFAALARETGVLEAELLDFGRRHLGGALRRYVATFRHRKLGVRGNGMVVWDVSHARRDEVGRRLAAAPEVSHCYARAAAPGFPYTVYSMIHGPDEAAVRTVADRLADEVGVTERAVLFSTRELKKARLRYFLPELADWCREQSLVPSERAA